MKNFFLLTVLLLPFAAEAQKTPKRIALSSTSTVVASDIRKGFQKKCPNVSITVDASKADYALEAMAGTMNPISGIMVMRYRFTLFNRAGDAIYSTSPHDFSNAINNVCMTINKPRSFTSPVTKPNGSRNEYRNEFLMTYLSPDGAVVFKPGGAGTVREDGSLEMKFPWTRFIKAQLTVEGHRLDGSAPPLRALIPAGYGDTGFQSTALIFPTPGCWEVTGHVGNGRLTFVIRVVKIGEGPQRSSL